MTLDRSLYEEGVKMAEYREQRIKFGTNHYPIYKPMNPYDRIDRRIKKDISHLQISKERNETKTKTQKKRAKRIKIKEKNNDLFELLSTLQSEPSKKEKTDTESIKKPDNESNEGIVSVSVEKDGSLVKPPDNINRPSDQKKTITVSNVEPDTKKQGQPLVL